MTTKPDVPSPGLMSILVVSVMWCPVQGADLFLYFQWLVCAAPWCPACHHLFFILLFHGVFCCFFRAVRICFATLVTKGIISWRLMAAISPFHNDSMRALNCGCLALFSAWSERGWKRKMQVPAPHIRFHCRSNPIGQLWHDRTGLHTELMSFWNKGTQHLWVFGTLLYAGLAQYKLSNLRLAHSLNIFFLSSVSSEWGSSMLRHA